MSANPLRRPQEQQAPGYTEERLMAECLERNRRCRAIGWQRWYYVEPGINGAKPELRTVEGIEAEEVWTVLDGHRIDYMNWPQHKLDKIERRARWLITQGGATPSAPRQRI